MKEKLLKNIIHYSFVSQPYKTLSLFFSIISLVFNLKEAETFTLHHINRCLQLLGDLVLIFHHQASSHQNHFFSFSQRFSICLLDYHLPTLPSFSQTVFLLLTRLPFFATLMRDKTSAVHFWTLFTLFGHYCSI